MSKEAFIRLAIAANVLQFGQFTLKSGRQSPYFFNAGLFYQGDALRQVGQCYADLLLAHHVDCQHLFGPAYKGLPLATATAIALAEKGVHAAVTFNRKEVKDHGEGGLLIGAPLRGEVVMIDDVITAGTAFWQAEQLIRSHHARISTVVIALDRCEPGRGVQSTLEEIKASGVQVLSIISVLDVIDFLKAQAQYTQAAILQDYLAHLAGG